MKKYFYFIFFLFFLFNAYGSHIVGGEIEIAPLKTPLLGTNPATHEVTLNLYFDAINGRAAAEDLSITLYFIRKRDLARVGQATCQRIYRDLIKYVDPSCEQKGDLETLLIKYRSLINLPDELFSDPEGYMVVWERCCRNIIITNIRNPSTVGMVFYTEFPTVKTVNTTPHFRDVIADYICINQNFEMDFSAIDVDGDSLTYELVTPWMGNATSGNPNPISVGTQNYREVTWVDGISLDNVIPGEIPLRIDPQTGVLFVKPNKLGLYVFSVMVNEYRKGVKIGRMKRDFQLKVIDCKINNPPQVLIRNQNTKSFFKEGETIFLKKGDKRCFDVLYTDPDINQTVTITAKGVNFDTKKINIPAVANVVIVNKDTLKTTFCLDDCILTKNNQAAEFLINISDNGCPVPQNRGYRMKIQFEEVQNNKPTLTTTLSNDIPTVQLGDTLKFTVFGNDIDLDTLTLTGTGRNFSMGNLGFSFSPKQGVGNVSSLLQFIPNCEAIKQKQVLLDFVTKDLRCGVSNQTLLSVPVNIKAKVNNAPTISSSLVNRTVEIFLSPSQPAEVKFSVNAQDLDNEQMSLVCVPKDFELKNAIMTFDNKEGKGKLSSIFTWNPNCFMLAGKDSREFIVNFRTQDKSCEQKQDTISIKFILKDNLSAENPIKPHNTFTPNSDGFNDYFTLGAIPGDNCRRQFVKFEIFNRWGKVIFNTSEREFKWTGDNEPMGEYFYALYFSDDVFKGVIHLVR